MDSISGLGKALVFLGGLILLIGLALIFFEKIPFIGRLPGDLRFQWRSITVHAPLATSLILSVILTVLLNLFLKR
ncbi:MAG: DUF2905 domain-containing protein [Candidatus Latescibacteria bacterium]|jgi:hypothetical protein|nr:DUF2905 domain-containing protein [Candidatus Latescibacterota bacterium]